MDNAKYVAGEAGVDLDVDNLYVKQAVANDGPRMKRIRPAPMGRAYRYQRRLTHIVLSVAEREGSASLVTRVEEPAVSDGEAKSAKAKGATKPRAAVKAKKAAPKAHAKTAAKPGAGKKAKKKS